MRAIADALLAVFAVLVVIAIAGDEVARSMAAVAPPLCAVIAALILARLVWFYTTRW
jgi:hypothetical protein